MALKFVDNRIIVSIAMEYKNSHTFSNGMEIRLERKYNNFNLREVNPQNAFVVSAKDIPTGAEILIDYNSTHPTYALHNYKPLSGDEVSSDVKYFSVPIEECYLWRMLPNKGFTEDGKTWIYGGRNSEDWQPISPYTIAERVFEPYAGILQGIEPKQIKDTLYIKSGELKNKIVRTLQACDYAIVFRDTNGQENQIIVCRHYEDIKDDNEYFREEITCIDNWLTERLKNGELLIGLTTKDAKPLKSKVYA